MRLTDDLHAPETRQAMLFAVGVWVAAVPVFLSPSFATGAVPRWAWAAYISLALVGVLLSPVAIGSTRAAEALPRRWRLPFIVLAVAAVGALHGAIDVLLQQYFVNLFNEPARVLKFVGPDGRAVKPPFHFLAALNFLTLVWLHGVVAALGAVSRFHWIIRRQQRSIAAASEAKLEALRFQLNPHFLFNTLNVLSALIVTAENHRAERLLGQLSDFLRATLVAPDGLVRLQQELEVVQSYLDIEATRMGGLFSHEIVCPPELADAAIPPLILLPLVEKAVAGAMRSPRSGARVTLEAGRGGGGRVLAIRVRGLAEGATDAPDVWDERDFRAVRERIASHFGSAGVLTVEDARGGFSARLTLPLEADGRERRV